MSWLSVIAGLVRPAKELVEVFKPNAEKEAERGHAERLALSAQDLASLQQFAAEFQLRAKSTWWDSFIDGLNRLPRPLITLSVGSFFVLAPLDPLRFAQVARAYELMPDGFWALLSIIVAFYFGGRMRLKRQDMAVKGDALAVAREVLALQRAAREHDQRQRAEPAHGAPAAEPAHGAPAAEPAHGAPAAEPAHGEPAVEPAALPNRVIETWQRRRALAAQG